MAILSGTICGCSLRTGAQIAGWYTLIMATMQITFCVMVLVIVHLGIYHNNTEMSKLAKDVAFISIAIVLGIQIVFEVLRFIASILLLVGIGQERPDLFWPWVIINILQALIMITVAILSLFLLLISETIIAILFAILYSYMTFVVINHYYEYE